jgi:hypothetical protein
MHVPRFVTHGNKESQIEKEALREMLSPPE